MVNQERMKLFIQGLRSKRFKQGTGCLTEINSITGEEYDCCLGVQVKIAIENGCEVPSLDIAGQRWYLSEAEYEDRFVAGRYDYGNSTSLPRLVAEWYGLDPDINNPLVRLENGREVFAITANDSHGLDFPTIADAFERTYITEVDQ